MSTGAWRISDLDRDNAASLLATAMEQGRITPIEYSDRCAVVYNARTRDELLEVLADLPGGPEAGLAPLVLNVPFGQVRRTGEWAVPELVQITGTGQRTLLDLTGAHLQRPEVLIEVSATMTSTVVFLPAHAEVDIDGLELVAGTVRRRTNPGLVRGWAGSNGVGLPGGWNPATGRGGPNGRSGPHGRGGLLRRRAREEQPPLTVVLRGRARLSSVTLVQARPGRR
jgi:hypothetical protein